MLRVYFVLLTVKCIFGINLRYSFFLSMVFVPLLLMVFSPWPGSSSMCCHLLGFSHLPFVIVPTQVGRGAAGAVSLITSGDGGEATWSR